MTRCMKTLQAVRLQSLSSTLYDNSSISNLQHSNDLNRYDFTTKFEGSIMSELISPAISSGVLRLKRMNTLVAVLLKMKNNRRFKTGVCPSVAACSCLITMV
jgi:hypothetical protein